MPVQELRGLSAKPANAEKRSGSDQAAASGAGQLGTSDVVGSAVGVAEPREGRHDRSINCYKGWVMLPQGA